MKVVDVRIPATLADETLCGVRVREHWRRLVCAAGARVGRDEPTLVVDGSCVGIDARDLEWALTIPGVLVSDGRVIAAPGTHMHLLGEMVRRAPPARAVPEALHVRDLLTLEVADTALTLALIEDHVRRGVRFVRRHTNVVHADVVIEPGATIWPNAMLLGDTHIGRGAVVAAGAWVENARVAPGDTVEPHAIVRGSGPRSAEGRHLPQLVDARPARLVLLDTPDGDRGRRAAVGGPTWPGGPGDPLGSRDP